jgi:pimeloyl-ACP methyl ester carboxylesterase
VDLRDTRYVKTPDGAYIAYQTAGEGPIDLVWQFDFLGNVDLVWEWPHYRGWLPGLAAFSRVILHDRRGTGLSSRNVAPPNLETRVSDLRLVLDAVGSDRPVLAGYAEAGAPNVLFAATNPERVRSIVWFGPLPRVLWTPDFPWGAKPNYVEREDRALELWGTREYGAATAESSAEWTEGFESDPEITSMMGMMCRQTTSPDVARALTRIWHDTDVRGVLPSVRAPTLLVADERYADDFEVAEYAASLMPDARVASTPNVGPPGDEFNLDLVRRFLGVERPPPNTTRSLPRSCSPTSSARPRSRRRSETVVGGSSSRSTMRSFGRRWGGGGGWRTTPPATASTRPSTDRRGRSAARSRSPSASENSGSRSEPVCTRASASSSRASARASPSRSVHGWRRTPGRQRCSFPRP